MRPAFLRTKAEFFLVKAQISDIQEDFRLRREKFRLKQAEFLAIKACILRIKEEFQGMKAEV